MSMVYSKAQFIVSEANTSYETRVPGVPSADSLIKYLKDNIEHKELYQHLIWLLECDKVLSIRLYPYSIGKGTMQIVTPRYGTVSIDYDGTEPNDVPEVRANLLAEGYIELTRESLQAAIKKGPVAPWLK